MLVCLPRAAPMGLSPLLILTLCGSERVLVVSTEPPDDLSCSTTAGIGRPRDGLLPVPLTRGIQMHTPSLGGGGGKEETHFHGTPIVPASARACPGARRPPCPPPCLCPPRRRRKRPRPRPWHRPRWSPAHAAGPASPPAPWAIPRPCVLGPSIPPSPHPSIPPSLHRPSHSTASGPPQPLVRQAPTVHTMPCAVREGGGGGGARMGPFGG